MICKPFFVGVMICCAISLGAHAYDSKDIITINGRTITLKNPLLASNPPSWLKTALFEAIFPELHRATTYIALPQGQCPTHIVCRWVVDDGMLYLSFIEPYTKDLFPRETPNGTENQGFDISKYIPTPDSIKSRVERITGQKFDNRGLLPALWVSGTISGGADFVSYEYFLNQASFEVKNGRIVKKKIGRRKAKLYDNPEAIDSLLTNGITLWDEIAKLGITEPILFENRENKWQANLSGKQAQNIELVELTEKIGKEIAITIESIPRSKLSAHILHFTRHCPTGSNYSDRFLAIALNPTKRAVNFSGAFQSRAW